jgi:GT2 family glycosyltransferase
VKYDYCVICPEDPALVWYCVPVWNALKAKGNIAVLLPGMMEYSGEEWHWEKELENLLPGIDFFWEMPEATRTIKCLDSANCHLAIANMKAAGLDYWHLDYSCNYKKGTSTYLDNLINCVRHDAPYHPIDTHIRALFGIEQRVVYPEGFNLFTHRPLHWKTRAQVEETKRCAVFMLTHDIPLDMLETAIDTTVQGITDRDIFTIIASAARPDMVELIRRKNINCIECSENLYFMNFNLAAEIAPTQYVCFLNDDIAAEPGWLDALLAPLDSKIGKVSGFEISGGVFDHEKKLFKHAGWGDCGQLKYIDGWCVCADRKFFLDIGGFSLWIWGKLRTLYAEDSDFSFKVKERGENIVSVSPCMIKHLRSKSTRNADMIYSAKYNNKVVYQEWANKILKGKVVKVDNTFHLNPNVEGVYEPKINLWQHPFLGDAITGMAAAEHIARIDGFCEICNLPFDTLFQAYKGRAGITHNGTNWQHYMNRIIKYHLVPYDHNKHHNYVGAMMAATGHQVAESPEMLCPHVEPLPELTALGKYVIIQPFSNTNHQNDLPVEAIGAIVQVLKSKGIAAVVSGRSDERIKGIKDVHCAFGDALNYCRAVKGAIYALGSESGMAHIAAGYKVPMIMWIRPERKPFMWLFNYPGWEKLIVDNNPQTVLKIIMGGDRIK